LDPTIVVIGFVVLLAALLYFMYKDHSKIQTVSEPTEKKKPTVVKVKDYETQLEVEKEAAKTEPQPEPKAEVKPEPKLEPVVEEAPAKEPTEEGLENLSGIGEKYRTLLKAAGVETLPALAKWDAKDLHEKLMEVNESQEIVKRPPPLVTVEDWVKRAGERTN
jgi:predicted flap endonuclease-1-like 5' DNA nuclease